MVNELAYNLYLYVFGFLFRGRLGFGYYLINIILPETVFTVVTTLAVYRLVPVYQQEAGRDEKKERHDHCLTTCMRY